MKTKIAKQPSCSPSRNGLRFTGMKTNMLLAVVVAVVASFLIRESNTPAEPAKLGCQTFRQARGSPAGLREFYRKTALPDGSFRPGGDPAYEGMSDSAYSDMAPTTYAVVLHRTFGWTLPHEDRTLARVAWTGSKPTVPSSTRPAPPICACRRPGSYNTTQGIVALVAPVPTRHDPRPVFAEVMRDDYKGLPAYSTSFFPLAYELSGEKLPAEYDRKLRSQMIQADDGYLNDHIAATFHAVHYYRLVGTTTPKSEAMVARALRDQKPDGSWLLNPPARDRHATFDAVFVLKQMGGSRENCQQAIARAGRAQLAATATVTSATSRAALPMPTRSTSRSASWSWRGFWSRPGLCRAASAGGGGTFSRC